MSNTLAVSPLYIKSFGLLILRDPPQRTRREELHSERNLDGYVTLEEYLASLDPGDKTLIKLKILKGLDDSDTMPPIVERLYLPIILNGEFPPEDELRALMKEFDIPDMEALEMNLYDFLLKITSRDLELELTEVC